MCGHWVVIRSFHVLAANTQMFDTTEEINRVAKLQRGIIDRIRRAVKSGRYLTYRCHASRGIGKLHTPENLEISPDGKDDIFMDARLGDTPAFPGKSCVLQTDFDYSFLPVIS